MDSRLKAMALQVAGWGLLYGDFFDLHIVSDLLQVPHDVAGDAVIYLRNLGYVETVAETRSCKREPSKRSSHRVFIKVIAIHPEPKWEPVQQPLARLVKIMPSPRGAR